jgi:type II secretory pathway component PulF
MSGVFLFIMPQLATTLAEVTDGGRLPAITHFLFNITRSQSFLIIFSLILIILIPSPVFFFIRMYLKLRPRNPDEPYFLSIVGDKIKWYLPVLHWFEKNYSMVQTIEMLRLSLNAGYPVNEAIANTITLDVNCCFKKRLRNWLDKVESGFNISESARNCKLGQSLAWAFDEKVNQGNTIHILEALESFYRSNYSYCVNLARFIFWPCVIILLGFVVSMVILAVFLPMIHIINSLTGIM